MAKKKSSRRAYLDSFTLTPDGKYEYSGEYRVLTGDNPAKKLTAWLMLSLLCSVCTVICGCIPAPGMRNTFYVILPCTVSIIASLATVYGEVKMGFSGRLRTYTYKETVGSLPLRCMITAIFSGLSVICEVICLILQGAEKHAAYSVLFILLHLIAQATSLLLRRSITCSVWGTGK